MTFDRMDLIMFVLGAVWFGVAQHVTTVALDLAARIRRAWARRSA